MEVNIMDKKNELKREYKENPPLAGIYKITNNKNGKIFVGKGLNVQGRLNRHTFELNFGSDNNKELQDDWKKYGADSFTLEVIDQLKPSDNSQNNITEELNELEALWLSKLSPYNEKGYNKLPK